MVPHEACSRGDRFAVDAGKALDKDEIEEERVSPLLAARDQEMLGAEEVDELVSEGEDGVEGAGVDITFLTAPLPGLSIRLISRWKVLILASVQS